MPNALYDDIGATYAATRRTDPRIAEQIWAGLGDARAVVNVGAGTGSYEPTDRTVLAVEPSAVMRAQRRPGSAPCLAATAERLPFVVFTFDLGALRQFWLTRDYLPELLDMLTGHPDATAQAAAIGASVEPVLIPRDCVDGFRAGALSRSRELVRKPAPGPRKCRGSYQLAMRNGPCPRRRLHVGHDG